MLLNRMAILRAVIRGMPARVPPDSVNPVAEREALLKMCRSVLEDVLAELTPVQARVLRLRYGLEGWPVMSVKEISHVMIIRSPGEVEQVRRSAIRAIQRNPRSSGALKVFH